MYYFSIIVVLACASFAVPNNMVYGKSFVLDEVPFYATSDERIVEIQGDSLKVLRALEAVVGHLRKFLVDHTVIPLFEKTVSLLLPFFCLFIFYFKALMLIMELTANVSFNDFFSNCKILMLVAGPISV